MGAGCRRRGRSFAFDDGALAALATARADYLIFAGTLGDLTWFELVRSGRGFRMGLGQVDFPRIDVPRCREAPTNALGESASPRISCGWPGVRSAEGSLLGAQSSSRASLAGEARCVGVEPRTNVSSYSQLLLALLC